jgi:hypothetical protein
VERVVSPWCRTTSRTSSERPLPASGSRASSSGSRSG